MAKYIVITIVFLALLYFASRYLVQFRKSNHKGTIRVTDIVKLGPDSYVFVVEAMGNKYLIAQNKHAIQLLDRMEAGSFHEVLHNEILQNKEREQGDFAAVYEPEAETGADTSEPVG